MEIIPKKPLKPSKSLKVLLYFSLVFLFFSIASFFALGYFVEKFQREQTALEQTLTERVPQEKLEPLETEVLVYQRKINNFSFLIDQHIESSRFFTAFEKIVHPQIWFSEFNLNLREKKVTMSGRAENLEALKQQIFIFQNAKDLIREVDFTIDVETILEPEINFSLSFTIIL